MFVIMMIVAGLVGCGKCDPNLGYICDADYSYITESTGIFACREAFDAILQCEDLEASEWYPCDDDSPTVTADDMYFHCIQYQYETQCDDPGSACVVLFGQYESTRQF
jgi:hypothetical protein